MEYVPFFNKLIETNQHTPSLVRSIVSYVCFPVLAIKLHGFPRLAQVGCFPMLCTSCMFCPRFTKVHVFPLSRFSVFINSKNNNRLKCLPDWLHVFYLVCFDWFVSWLTFSGVITLVLETS